MSTPTGFPCIDPQTRRYRSFPCSQCKATSCAFGKKPTPNPKSSSERRDTVATYHTCHQAADILGVSYYEIQKRIRSGELRAIGAGRGRHVILEVPRDALSEADEYPPCEICGLPVQPDRNGDAPLRHPECQRVRFCGHCGQKYTRPKGTRGLYCADSCRYEAMMQRRRARQVDPTERGLKYTGATAERS